MHGLNTGSQYCHSSFATVQSRLISNMSDAESVTGRSEGRGTERSEQRTEQRTPDDLQPLLRLTCSKCIQIKSSVISNMTFLKLPKSIVKK